MFRKATAAALVLSAVPAVLAMTFLAGAAQADDVRWSDGLDSRWTQVLADGDTPWGAIASDDDTPWGPGRAASVLAVNGDATQDGDTPWR